MEGKEETREYTHTYIYSSAKRAGARGAKVI
jgi:hypothetical protein